MDSFIPLESALSNQEHCEQTTIRWTLMILGTSPPVIISAVEVEEVDGIDAECDFGESALLLVEEFSFGESMSLPEEVTHSPDSSL